MFHYSYRFLFIFLLFPFAIHAENITPDPFLEVVKQYQAANPKPELTEEAHKYKVQAEFAVQEKRYSQAVELYDKALKIAPWWADGHYKLALVLSELRKFRDAIQEMNRFKLLAPDSPDLRAAQDKIYQWESVAEPEAGKTFRDCPECPEMVELPAGSFTMGSEDGAPEEMPAHQVTLSHKFAIGKTEVTQQQWQSIMGNNPSYFADCGDTCPVEQVSWEDVQEYIKLLNAKTGKQFRLPTEAEWEYACRAGKQELYCGSDRDENVAWTSTTGGFFFNSPNAVAAKKPNAFGLYDMSGNVWEWVEDTWHDNYKGAPADGSAWMGGKMRVLRGGSWGKKSNFSRATSRFKFTDNYRDWSYGFRLALTLP